MYELTRSSSGSGRLSLTLKGLLTFLIPLVIALGKDQGLPLTEADLTLIIQEFAVILASITTIVGLFRKMYYWLTT